MNGCNSTKIYGPDFFMQHDVLLVIPNFRSSVFGFLSFNDPSLEVPGNAGLKDQRLALKWIKENISAFGGDPEQVTIYGHSTGAACAQYHLLTPSCKGLFQRAIVSSGSALTPWGITDIPGIGETLARNTGWNGSGERGALEHLMKLDADVLRKAADPGLLVTADHHAKDIYFAFAPVIEPYELEPYCTADRLELVETCWGNEIEVIFSVASNEGLLDVYLFLSEVLKSGIPDSVLVPYKRKIKMNAEKISQATSKLKNLYNNFEGFGPENIQPYIDVSIFKFKQAKLT